MKPINETNLKMTQMIELAVKNIKMIIIEFFPHIFKNSRRDMEDIIKDKTSGDENCNVCDEKYTELYEKEVSLCKRKGTVD